MRNVGTILAAATLCAIPCAVTPAGAHSYRHHAGRHRIAAPMAAPPVSQPLGFLASLFGAPAAPVPVERTPFYRHGRTLGRAVAIVAAPAVSVAHSVAGLVGVGKASFYSGGRTASGGSVGAATCAHRTLPFGTRVLVTNLANNRRAVLTVNDRGPFVRGRIVDVSRTAAGTLGMIGSGVAPVRVEVVASR